MSSIILILIPAITLAASITGAVMVLREETLFSISAKERREEYENWLEK